ncbi:hypothetical protein FRC00_004428 [Tulasnella sp. 408]|nr:hypothetical protein FRC00_004428 [Tulasnella sp. 408]
MSSQCLFDGGGRDVLALVSRVDTLGPQNLESAADCAHDWDALAADIAASYFTGDILRWYEGLGAATQESWVLLRASLLATYVIEDDDSSDDDGIIGSQAVQADCVIPSKELQTPGSSLNTKYKADNGGYTVKIRKGIMQQLSTALRIAQQSPSSGPQQTYTTRLRGIIVLAGKHLKSNYPCPIRLDPRCTGLINLSRLQVGFRLAKLPAPDERTHVSMMYKSLPPFEFTSPLLS